MSDGVVSVLVPANEEGTRATVLRWLKNLGEAVAKDEPLVELETDKVTVEVPSPSAGVLAEIHKEANEEVRPAEVLASIRTSLSSEAVQRVVEFADADPDAHRGADGGEPARSEASPGRGPGPVDDRLSPAVRRLLRERGLEPAQIRGTGRGGRITADDVERHARPEGAVQRVPHSAIRRRVAEHMARSLAEAPHVTTIFEADLTRVLAHRAAHAQDFAGRGVRLTLTAYLVRACALALARHPQVNATYHADALELHPEANVGVGTALGERGLIVPVIHGAQRLGLYETARRLGEKVEAARAGKLTKDDVRGGTFTLSNHGVGGSLLAAPIVIHQPQVAILGVGKVQRRVVVVDIDGAEAIAVRSMCYLTLSLDHRALDAFQANAFLSDVVGTLEAWSEPATL